MNNNQIKSAIFLMENLLKNPKKYGRKSLSEKLREEELPHTDSAVTRLLKTIDKELGVAIKTDRTDFTFVIDYENSIPNYKKRYDDYKGIYFRSLLQKQAIEKNIVETYISFGFDTQNKNIEYLEPFMASILEQKRIEIQYHPFYESVPKTYTVSPIFIKEYLGRWYLITEHLEGRHPIFAVDRIENYEVLDKTFERTGAISSEIFKNTLGVNFSDTVAKIKLWVSNQQYPYFKTLPLHKSQKIEEKLDDGFIISLEVTVNFELKQWILFFGSSVKVLEPKALRDDIIDELTKNIAHYQK